MSICFESQLDGGSLQFTITTITAQVSSVLMALFKPGKALVKNVKIKLSCPSHAFILIKDFIVNKSFPIGPPCDYWVDLLSVGMYLHLVSLCDFIVRKLETTGYVYVSVEGKSDDLALRLRSALRGA